MKTKSNSDLRLLLDHLLAEWESEVAEFKNVSDSYSTSDIGKYFSALANEANLRGIESAWLIFGVDDKARKILGSTYRTEADRLNGLKLQIARDTEPGITFREIHVLETESGRVVMFEIPAAPVGIPIAWKGHWYARAGESLTHLGLDKLDAIRAQTAGCDWSAVVIEGATMEHLDPAALARAKADFSRKHANRFSAEEVAGWSNRVFLDRAKLTLDGAITRTALLLLGKAESSPLLSPHPAQITWRLEGPERAYQHFGPPFLLNTSAVYQKIRNIQIRILPDDELLAIEVAKYDQKIILEALHNCIAHQDYSLSARIVVTEFPDKLVFANEGTFFEGVPADYLQGHKTPRRYRNPFLTQAMVELNMIDTMGYGIHEIYLGQARRFLPMPDYDLSQPRAVRLVIHGRIVDPAYSRLLIQHTDLSLPDVLALDRVQKGLPLEEDAVRRLRRSKLIEGRKPHFHVSAAVASAAETKAAYIKTRALDDGYYLKLATDYLEKFDGATRADMDHLLREKLSSALSETQKATKIGNLLTAWRKKEIIYNKGTKKRPLWSLCRPPAKKE